MCFLPDSAGFTVFGLVAFCVMMRGWAGKIKIKNGGLGVNLQNGVKIGENLVIIGWNFLFSPRGGMM